MTDFDALRDRPDIYEFHDHEWEGCRYIGTHNTEPFVLGGVYKTFAGAEVTIVEVVDQPFYESVRGDDGKWRYNRMVERGRVTGTRFNKVEAHPDNLIPEAING